MVGAELPILAQRHAPVAPASWQRPSRDSDRAPAARSVSAQDHGSQSTTGRGTVRTERWYELRWREHCETAAASPSDDDILAPRHTPRGLRLMREQSPFAG